MTSMSGVRDHISQKGIKRINPIGYLITLSGLDVKASPVAPG